MDGPYLCVCVAHTEEFRHLDVRIIAMLRDKARLRTELSLASTAEQTLPGGYQHPSVCIYVIEIVFYYLLTV